MINRSAPNTSLHAKRRTAKMGLPSFGEIAGQKETAQVRDREWLETGYRVYRYLVTMVGRRTLETIDEGWLNVTVMHWESVQGKRWWSFVQSPNQRNDDSTGTGRQARWWSWALRNSWGGRKLLCQCDVIHGDANVSARFRLLVRSTAECSALLVGFLNTPWTPKKVQLVVEHTDLLRSLILGPPIGQTNKVKRDMGSNLIHRFALRGPC